MSSVGSSDGQESIAQTVGPARATNTNTIDNLLAGIEPDAPAKPTPYARQRLHYTLSSSDGDELFDAGDTQRGDTPEIGFTEWWNGKVPVAPVRVEISPIKRRWEYRTYNPEIRKVRREFEEGERVYYEVETYDGLRDQLPFETVISTEAGVTALEVFNQQSDDLDSDLSMVETRSRRTVVKRPGFLDTTKMDLDGDSDDITLVRSDRRKQGRVGQGYKFQELTSEDSSIESDFENNAPRTRLRQRKTASRSTRVTGQPKISYDYGPISESDGERGSGRSTRLGKRKRGKAVPAPSRRSERSVRQHGSMRERGEDDISEAEVKAPTAPKMVGAKEHFKHLPPDNEFKQRHCITCDTCGEVGDNAVKGHLVFCQSCTLSYHKSCLGVRTNREHLATKVGDHNFVLQCRRCIEFPRTKDASAPHQGRCSTCKQPGAASKRFRNRTSPIQEQREREANDGQDPIIPVNPVLLNNVHNVLFRCMTCFQAFHLYHLPSKKESVLDSGDNHQKAADRFSEYGRSWQCHECEAMPAKVDTIIAWRPTNQANDIAGKAMEEIEEDEKEYLIKWANVSYYRSTWKSGPWTWGMTAKGMRTAFARRDESKLPKMTTEDAIPEDYLRVDIVFDVKYNNVVNERIEEVDIARIKEISKAKVKFKGLGYEDVVWEEPPDSQDVDRWADFKSAYEDWVRGHYIHAPNQSTLSNHLRKLRTSGFKQKVLLEEQPKALTGGKLMDYQLDGINWLLHQWYKEHNAILADEMGLGKTIQVIGFLAALQQNHGCWPFLVIVPNATCANWRREIKQWAPCLRVVMYFGSAKAKELTMKHELAHDRPHDLKCHVVVTSYDAAAEDSCQKFFRKIHWSALIVDEGQRLKNDKTLLYTALTNIKTPFRLLLTGTPLQNNQRELFNLLQFCDKEINAQELEEKYKTLDKQNVIELHELIRPFFLRRTKAGVLTFLPPMAQIIVPVSMTTLQKQLYKSILAKNSDLLKAIFSREQNIRVAGLRNILMQLRKCLCHPFVYNVGIEEKSVESAVSHRRLVEASSKLQLLEIMLPILKERGHRCLIFSQFLDMLTITEDFLDGLAMNYSRIDGGMNSMEKQKVIDRFNAPNSDLFALLLSTRAGGVGINLATADTVIILDPDFNPHQDIQAISRAHRIGQTKKVLIFQLMTRESAEERVMQIGKKKMALDHVLIEQMDATEENGNELESVLRFGAEALFKDDDGSQDIKYDVASVKKLLDRTQIEDTKTGKDASAESQWSFARVWQNESGTLEDKMGDSDEDEARRAGGADPGLWDKILEHRAEEAQKLAQLKVNTFGRGKRARQTVNYGPDGEDVVTGGVKIVNMDERDNDSDTDYAAREESDDDERDKKAKDDERQEPDEQDSLRVEIDDLVDEHLAGRPPPLARVQNPAGARIAVSQPVAPPPEKASQILPCLACGWAYGPHEIGSCPLKMVGTELCNLCGLAHFGHSRTCPHIGSETQVRLMINAVKESMEDPALKKEVLYKLKGIKGHLVAAKKKKREAQAQAQAQAQAGAGAGAGAQAGTGAGAGGAGWQATHASIPARPNYGSVAAHAANGAILSHAVAARPEVINLDGANGKVEDAVNQLKKFRVAQQSHDPMQMGYNPLHGYNSTISAPAAHK